MMHLFAQTDLAAASNASSWLVVLTLGTLASLAIALKQLFSGNKGERQIEPTTLHAITSELKAQTTTLNKLDREMGGVAVSLASLQREITEVKTTTATDVNNAHQRIGGVSRDLAATIARVDGLEKREGDK